MSKPPDIRGVVIDQRQSALFVTLNRPDARNALTAEMVTGLIDLCARLEGRRDIRAIVLRGAGTAFCAGGDVKEFGRMLMTPEPAASETDQIAAGNRVFGDLLLALGALSQTLIVCVHGAAFGGANGFVAVADVAIAEASAKFSLSETTLGVVPAQIAPFLALKIGQFNTRRLALTGAHFSSDEAHRIGLVDRVAVGEGGLEAALVETLNAVGRCEPEANAATKKLIRQVGGAVDPATLDAAAQAFSISLRGKGREGAMAFAQKSTPPWVEAFPGEREA